MSLAFFSHLLHMFWAIHGLHACAVRQRMVMLCKAISVEVSCLDRGT